MLSVSVLVFCRTCHPDSAAVVIEPGYEDAYEQLLQRLGAEGDEPDAPPMDSLS
jgi:hypothetical protein